MLFRPELSLKMRASEKSPFYVLLDTSLSMNIADSSGKTRFKKVQEFIAASPFLEKMKPVFYEFGQKPAKIDAGEIAVLRPHENSTSISGSLSEIAKISGGDCSGIILFTDGQETGSFDLEQVKNIVKCSVYLLGAGGENVPDASITGVISNSPVFSGETLKINVYGKLEGVSDADVRLRIMDKDRILQEKEIPVTGGNFQTGMEIKTDRPGESVYQAQILPLPRETVLENNSMPFLVRVVSPKIRIFYVEGGLRWEYKFLKRYLESSSSFEPFFLVRMGENLYQQTGGKSLGVPAGVFGDRKFLEGFDVIVLGSLDFSSFTEKQRENLKQFVVSGKSLLFLAGENFLTGIKGTGLEELMPVLLTGDEKTISTESIVPSPTLEAVNSGLFDNAPDFPPLSRANSVHSLRPGSTAIMTGSGNGRTILAAMNTAFEGKTFVVCTDDTWKWAFGKVQDKKAYEYFWGRTFRLLCGPEDFLGIGRVLPDIIPEKKIYGTGEEVVVRFVFREGKEQKINAFLSCPDNRKIPLEVKSGAASFRPDAEGVYLVNAENGPFGNLQGNFRDKTGKRTG